MKTIILSLFITVFSQCIFAQSLNLNSDDATVSFYFNGDEVEGSLGGFKSSITFDTSNPLAAKFKGSVDVSTIDTGIKMRDKHLTSKDYFEADTYPKMTFESTSVVVKDDKTIITGNLKIKSTTREETFILSIKDGKLELTSSINTADYDVMKKNKREKTQVDITITIPFS